MISLISSLSLKLYLNSLVYHRNIFGSSSKVFGYLRASSDIFGHSRKMFGSVRPAFGTIFEISSEIFGRWSEIFGKSSKTPSASKCSGKLVNEFFTYLKDITLSPGYLKGWRIFLSYMYCCHLCTENPSKNSSSRQLRMVTLIVSGSDRLTEICFSPNSSYSF